MKWTPTTAHPTFRTRASSCPPEEAGRAACSTSNRRRRRSGRLADLVLDLSQECKVTEYAPSFTANVDAPTAADGTDIGRVLALQGGHSRRGDGRAVRMDYVAGVMASSASTPTCGTIHWRRRRARTSRASTARRAS